MKLSRLLFLRDWGLNLTRIITLLFVAISLYSSQKELDYYRELSSNVDLFFNTYQQLNNKYVDSIDPRGFILSGIKSMLETLDPYTILLEGRSKTHYDDLTKGKYGGIGVYIGTSGSDKRLTVVSPIDDSPASKVGLKAGDRIMKIDDFDTKGLTSGNASKYLRGEKGSTVVLEIERIGEKRNLFFEIERDEIKINNVPYAGVVDGVGYIKVSQFSNGTSSDVKRELLSLLDSGVEGIILDLRFNPGGLLTSAVEITNLFLDRNKKIVSTRGKNNTLIKEYKTNKEPVSVTIPLVILINSSSASASEIVSGAIQDYDRGVIVGEGSFGKGLVQQIYNVNDTTSLKITIAKYYTPSGRLIQKLDYFSEHTKSIPSDTLSFFTESGRVVKSGKGIIPDLSVKSKKYSDYIAFLRMKNCFNNFTYKFLKENQDYKFRGDIESFVVKEFKDYIKDLEIDFKLKSEILLDSLKKISNDTRVSELVDDIAAINNDIKSKLFDDNLKDIKNLLAIDFTTRFFGNRSKYKVMLNDDDQLNKAISIIKNRDEYFKLLEPIN
ncbi:MAG: hypothetical protein CR982_03935 [Candidatus Cloacimonadota bacterium]|nr:MAG: hypothetical protein CR982_03935 [Candidatus Cloacimonadota bacterium]PIE77682.1 MAG: hypothetical protein CSA15_11715 [Candidatus Delongbacteria bacterium]